MNTRQIRNLLYTSPHRLNDEHVEYLLELVEDLHEANRELEADNKKLRSESMQNSQSMIGKMLTLAVNRPEIFTKKE